MKKLLLGAHMSIEGGLYKALERGASIGCTVIQIFTKSNRQWFAKPLQKTEIEKFKTTLKETKIESVTAHASYLINLASPNTVTRTRSISALKKELECCDALGIKYLVLHPGSHVKQGVEKGLQFIVSGIDAALENFDGKTMLLLETMAGQGSSLGGSFEEINFIRKNSSFTKKIGVCFDTCHVFAAGYDLRKKTEYEKVFKEFDKKIGLSHLKVFHINDSKKDFNSRVDRHEHVGEGKLGIEAFSLLFNDARFFDLPKILETPKESLLEDQKNMQTIISLLTSATKNALK